MNCSLGLGSMIAWASSMACKAVKPSRQVTDAVGPSAMLTVTKLGCCDMSCHSALGAVIAEVVTTKSQHRWPRWGFEAAEASGVMSSNY